MTDGLRWVCEAYPFGHTLVFCEGVAPEQVLLRLGAPRESLFPLTRFEAQEIEVRNAADEPYDLDHLDGLDVEAVEERGFLRPEVDAVLRAGAIEGWGFAVQTSTSYVSARDYLPALSRGTRVVTVCQDVNATQRVEYAVDGRGLSSFDPGIPAYDDGVDPSAMGWPAADGPMGSPQVMEWLEHRFGLWLPRASEHLRLPAAAFVTGRPTIPGGR
ncbi:DUF6461 domain-containing protein [Streptomyces sp. SP18BB07]|uniref:DUF6461 domain-containing protein n=1 Tax=Streptomyces sp. SP18BB07 TaxID=3002522 RepID=UPI002E7991B2|nr:DUF6461 domain-containing protein [Streptomyces sp. SP18BB07]MEE1759800.1 DUF6461 domain-containing protein [Streptomyces sp. SP18BB07]